MTHKGRTILVTGAASGIGAAVCRIMAGPGDRFLVHTRSNHHGAERTAEIIRAAGGEAELVLSDLSEPGTGTEAVDTAIRHFGGLDVLIANAGYADRSPLLEVESETYHRAAQAISGSFFEMARAAAPHLRASAAGRVVAVSAFGPHVWRTQVQSFPATAAAKASMESLVHALALEMAADGVTANAVAPGFIRKDAGTHTAITPETLARVTSQIPMQRVGEAGEVARVIAFLASPEASYVTGQVIHVSGGLV